MNTPLSDEDLFRMMDEGPDENTDSQRALSDEELFNTANEENERGFFERMQDAYVDTAREGMGWLARRGQYYLGGWDDVVRQQNPNLSDEEVNRITWDTITQVDREDRERNAARQDRDAAWRDDEGFFENVFAVDRWLPTVVGTLGGSASPIDFFAPGASTAARRIGSAAGLNAAEDVALQGVDIADNVQDEYSLSQTAIAAGLGAGLQGAFEVPKGLMQPKTSDIPDIANKIDTQRAQLAEAEGVPAPATRFSPEELELTPEMEAPDLDLSNFENASVSGRSGRMAYETTIEAPEGRQIYAEYTPSSGKETMRNQITIRPDGDATINLDTDRIGQKAAENTRGPTEVREALEEIITEFPEIRTITAERKSGAKAGTPNSQMKLSADKVQNFRDRLAAKQPLPQTDAPSTRADIREEEIVSRLTEALDNAEKYNVNQKALRTKARQEKLKNVAKARAAGSGRSGFRAELAALKGELPKVEFEPLEPNFRPEEVEFMFDNIKNNPKLSYFDAINARTGLARMLEGQLPRPSELNVLRTVYGDKFTDALQKKRGAAQKVRDNIANAVNLPRALMSSMDLSAPGRQGIVLIGRKEWWQSWGAMLKSIRSDEAYDALEESIKSLPTYDLMQQSGLGLTRRDGFTLTDMEEAFQTQWADKVPLVKASQRGFLMYLNKLRADSFNNMVTELRKTGVDFEANPEIAEDLARFINSATGRGDIGHGVIGQSSPIVNAAFFSPRLVKSRLDLTGLNPAFYPSLHPEVRKKAAKNMIAFGVVASTMATLLATAGFDVVTDPTSTDFAKIKAPSDFANTGSPYLDALYRAGAVLPALVGVGYQSYEGELRYDILGGFGQYLTLGARVASNMSTSIKGNPRELKGGIPDAFTDGDENEPKGPYAGSVGGALGRFARNKASPIASYVVDFLMGENVVGQDFYVPRDTLNRVTPLFVSDLIGAAFEDQTGQEVSAYEILGILGTEAGQSVGLVEEEQQGLSDEELLQLSEG